MVAEKDRLQVGRFQIADVAMLELQIRIKLSFESCQSRQYSPEFKQAIAAMASRISEILILTSD
jgi:hypothetical protein